MAILAIWTDRGIRKDAKGGHHIDKRRDNEGIPYLFSSSAATHVILSATSIQLFNDQEPGWKLSLERAPDDWILAVQQSSSIYLVLGDEPDPDRAAKELDSLVGRAVLIPVKSARQSLEPVESIADKLALVSPDFNQNLLTPLSEHQIQDAKFITIMDMIKWGLKEYLPMQVKGYPVGQVFHLLSDCAGSYKSRNIDLARAIKHACPRCGLTRDRNLLTLDKYDPLVKLTAGLGRAMAGSRILTQKPLHATSLMGLETALYKLIASYSSEEYRQKLYELLVHVQYAIQKAVFQQNNVDDLESLGQYGSGFISGPLCIAKIKTNNGWPDAIPLRSALSYYGYVQAPKSRELFSIMPAGTHDFLVRLPGVALELIGPLWLGEDYTTIAPLINISRDSYSSPAKIMTTLRHQAGLYHPHQPFGSRSEVKGGVL